jgi:hypothetical protein
MNAQVISLPSNSAANETSPAPVHLGVKYDGKPAGFGCTRTGTYWEALPEIVNGDLKVQKGLLGWSRAEHLEAYTRVLALCKQRENKSS